MENHRNLYYEKETGDYLGWIPSKTGFGGEYKRYESDKEYEDAFQEAITAS